MSFFHIVLVGIICAALGAACWFLAPRGKYMVLWRSSSLLTIVCCYLMWSVTYLAQLHPLVAPKRGDLRHTNGTAHDL